LLLIGAPRLASATLNFEKDAVATIKGEVLSLLEKGLGCTLA